MHVTTLVALSLLGASAALALTPSGSPASGASSAQSQGQEAVTRPNTDTIRKHINLAVERCAPVAAPRGPARRRAQS